MVFPYMKVATEYELYKPKSAGWHFSSVPTGGHRFIYAPGGEAHLKKLLKGMLDASHEPVKAH
jgi:hypothetical protein